VLGYFTLQPVFVFMDQKESGNDERLASIEIEGAPFTMDVS
jgi:hypothetical protein